MSWIASCLAMKAQKKQQRILLLSVGVARLERATACTPCKNASQLHHTPVAFNCVESFDLRLQRYECFLNYGSLSEKKVTFAQNNTKL